LYILKRRGTPNYILDIPLRVKFVKRLYVSLNDRLYGKQVPLLLELGQLPVGQLLVDYLHLPMLRLTFGILA
jgi:hypothetical protein